MRKLSISHRVDIINDPHVMALQIDELIIICGYNKPMNKNLMMRKLMKVTLDDIPLIMVRDFNLHHPMWDTKYEGILPDPITHEFMEWMDDNGFMVLNDRNKPTFISHQQDQGTQTVIDLLIVNQFCPHEITNHFDIRYSHSTGSDHFLICWWGEYELLPNWTAGELPFKKDPLVHDEWIDKWKIGRAHV